MTHWPGTTWREYEQWTESQFVVFYGALLRRLDREKQERERAREDRGRGGGGASRKGSASGEAGVAKALGQQSVRYPKLKSDRVGKGKHPP